ncbi:MAG: FAD-dependent oxidoreductase [Nitrososphaerales archaeon]|jgi:L-2-hydroxyglutarate oxidase
MSPASNPRKEVDVLVVGAGVLGVTTAYWLSSLYDCRILLVDRESGVARHTSSRNTGVIHRPFYLNPETKKAFALSARLSYPLWHNLASAFSLPWKSVGTLEVALREDDVPLLEKYVQWGMDNGMEETELELLDTRSVKSVEPEVECRAALHSKTDASVDFGKFTACVHRLAQNEGLSFQGGLQVSSLKAEGATLDVSFSSDNLLAGIRCNLLINAAGGGSVDIAHMMGLASEYSTLNFRGEYWVVDEPFGSRVGRNVYSLPRHPRFPFLDPHFVVRPDGVRQIGPNAVMVTGPYVYEGLGLRSLSRLFAVPNGPKLSLLSDADFLSMVASEWHTSLSKKAMCERVRRFIPGLDHRVLNLRGISGVRASVVGKEGFVPEAILVQDERSVHVLNYNSPGATGAPSYSASLVAKLQESGLLDGLRRKPYSPVGRIWDFDRAAGLT